MEFFCEVSIHAPTWGATFDGVLGNGWRVFQSTLPHGERPYASYKSALGACFNPRSHMGSDVEKKFYETYDAVSIHAPTWGATVLNYEGEVAGLVSIHAPTWGATLVVHSFSAPNMFQSTLPHGERRGSGNQSFRGSLFQSTLPHGERPNIFLTFLQVTGFQSTLPHGERRLGSIAPIRLSAVSIHAPTWGATVLSVPAIPRD